MKQPGRIIGVFVLLAVLVLLGKAMVSFKRFWNVESQFASVQVGQPRSTVLAKLGRPNYHEGSCGVIHVPDKRCAKEYVYSHPLAPWIPDYYIVSFSGDDRVIDADRWMSP